ncbi:MAG: DNA polymerase III subunit gamma/tau [Acidobacteria bacterium]|nr:DNA polymerase III subunit gamma/tau [Acidobacteriota bacterium]
MAAYQVLARKWRPQRFDEVVGQEPVTRTLRNAIASGRLAHAFVFAGPRGCGKTTTARILAKALNCVHGPSADPCGVCDACVEIAQGRDIDVLEIDAASHTGIDNIREVVIAGLPIAPVRDRHKIFIIDEVHQLSTPSFNALLKSIEEPPAHVVFMMATTELHKIPDTILSRSQVFEFRTISARAIAQQLRKIADAEHIDASDEALALIARAAEGSMRDAQSALDQVVAFAGDRVTVDEVSAVLGLVGRDLLFELVDAVVAEDGPRAFALADRAVESGHDLRLVVRELARVVRDMMLLAIDPARAGDGELAEGEVDRLKALGGRFSREDLLRAFDLLAKAEQEIRSSSQPRYHFEMVLLRWMHLRKLVPLTDLLEQLGARTVAPSPSARTVAPSNPGTLAPSHPRTVGRTVAPSHDRTIAPSGASGSLKDKFLNEVRAAKAFFYNTVVAQAQRIDVTEAAITFTFLPTHRALREQFEQTRPWLEAAAERVAGRKITVSAVQAAGSPQPAEEPPQPASAAQVEKAAAAAPAQRDLKAEALASSAVQAMLDVFPAEIRDVEEM